MNALRVARPLVVAGARCLVIERVARPPAAMATGGLMTARPIRPCPPQAGEIAP